MFPDSPFAVPRGSFERPVPLVLVDPCDDPSITVKINRAWVPYVLGALQQLVLQATWDTTDPDALWLVQQRAMMLLSCVSQAYDNPECEPGCASYPLDASILSWSPTDPFSDPEYVPPGYRFPAWFIAGDSVAIPGVVRGDMITDILHGPIVEPVSSGFPRFRITCDGTGTLNIEFVRFPTAGVALITIDGDLGSAKFVDLNISLAASIGTAASVMIYPVEITKDGNHVIDVTMLYSITEEPPFVHFGGGVRKVELCGFGVSPDPFPATYIVEESEYEMALCEQLKFEDGILKALCCGEWTAIPGQTGGTIPGGSTQPTHQPRPAPGQSTCFNVLLNATNQWQLPINVQDGDTITISNIQGAWTDGAVNWYCPTGFPYILNQCVESSRGHAGGDPDSTDFHMQLIAKVGSAFFPGTDGAFTIPGGTGVQTLVLQANDGTLGDNGGSISFKICIKNGGTPPVGEWCYIYDFTLDDYGWTPYFSGNDRAVYAAGFGWAPNVADGDGGLIQIQAAAFPSATIVSVELIVSDPLNGPTHEFTVNVPDRFGPDNTESSDTLTDVTIVLTTPTAGTGLFVNIASDPSNVVTYTGYLERVIIRGTGANPFGSDNC